MNTFSVVNGKLFRATSTARVEVPTAEAARLLNGLLDELRRIVEIAKGDTDGPLSSWKGAARIASAAISKAEGVV